MADSKPPVSAVVGSNSQSTAPSSSTCANFEDLGKWLSIYFSPKTQGPKLPIIHKVGEWQNIHLFLSSSFIDTHGERDLLIKHIIPSLNRKFASRFVRIIPVDLRWGVLAEETKDCESIQRTCLNQIEKCKLGPNQPAWFIGIRTERYGWVQDRYLPSYGFERPDHFRWLDEFSKSGKHVSITSLECLHALYEPDSCQRLPYPTVFFFQRNFLWVTKNDLF